MELYLFTLARNEERLLKFRFFNFKTKNSLFIKTCANFRRKHQFFI